MMSKPPPGPPGPPAVLSPGPAGGPLLTIEDAARRLAVTPAAIKKYIALGLLPAYKVGYRSPGTIRDTRPVRIQADDLETLIEKANN